MDLEQEKKEINFLKWSFSLAHILPFLYMFRPYSYPSVITLWLVLGTLINISKWNLIFKNNSIIFGLFFLGELISIAGYFVYDYSGRLENVSYILVAAFSFLLLPQFFFFLKGSLLSIDGFKELLRFVVILNFVCVLLGIILYILNPEFYANFVHNCINLSSSQEYFRMISYFGTSMITGLVCSISAFLTLNLFENKWYKNVFFFVFIIGLIMTMSRGAWLGFFVSCCYYFIFIKKLRIRTKTLIYFFFICFALIIYGRYLFADYLDSEDFNQLLIRIGHFTSATNERSLQWERAIGFFCDYPMGSGIGLLSHKAADSNLGFIVPDGNYFRILGELGVYGIFLFAILLVCSIYFSHKKKLYWVTGILIIYSLQAIGSNVFDLYYISYVFWLFVGFALSKKVYVCNINVDVNG